MTRRFRNDDNLDDKSTSHPGMLEERLIRLFVIEFENFLSLVATKYANSSSNQLKFAPSPAPKIIDAYNFKICSLALSVFDAVPNFPLC